MSKASEYSLKMETAARAKPFPLVGVDADGERNWLAKVGDGGNLILRGCELDHWAAMKLRDWLTDTFDEKKPCG